MINKLLTARKLPPLGERSAMTEKLLDGEYGRMPPKPDSIRYSVTENFIPAFCAGKAVSTKVDITVGMGGDEFTFPIYVSVPSRSGKHPFFVCINFRDCVPDRYIPVEEIIDSGYAVLSFCYHDVTRDNGDFSDGIAPIKFIRTEKTYCSVRPSIHNSFMNNSKQTPSSHAMPSSHDFCVTMAV